MPNLLAFWVKGEWKVDWFFRRNKALPKVKAKRSIVAWDLLQGKRGWVHFIPVATSVPSTLQTFMLLQPCCLLGTCKEGPKIEER